jgi:hypothetical protein
VQVVYCGLNLIFLLEHRINALAAVKKTRGLVLVPEQKMPVIKK